MEELVRILYKWAKPIAIVSITAALLSAVVSLLLPEYYKSSATVIPINPHLMDRSNLFNLGATETPVYLFGGKSEVSRLVLLSQSKALEEYIINKFNLFKHYDIDTTSSMKDYLASEELRDHFTTTKTPDGIVQIEVVDKDRNLAAAMANEIVVRLDTLNKTLINEKKSGLGQFYKQDLDEKEQRLEMLRDSLIRTLTRNPDDTVTAHVMERIIRRAVEEYNGALTLYEQHTAVMNQRYSTLYVVENATPAEKRFKPVRWLIVASATLVTLACMMLMAVFIEKFKNFNFNEPETI
ncbi:hypothetical protein C7N43_15400 [Sphingobacteriales bacterium UPWRP_1]|nr:hypothetical protein BVG80_08415 [Sphingobacteriales bacterium TSM_CSM]PSJ76161.1 hypothetical protein C7N43_15400 [Sphingobacteriales bacterium UPWRP_1]